MYAVAFSIAAALVSGRVLAEPHTADDPQAGFGVLIAMGAILVALIIARHKRQQYV